MKIRVLVALTAFLSAAVVLGQPPHAPTPTPAPVSPEAAAWVQKNLVGWPKMSIAVASDLIMIDRTRGELTVHCNNEQSNTLIFNIADDIMTGDRSVEQALAYHAQVIRGVQIGEPETYPYKLRFKAPQPSAASADPGDEAPLLKQLNAAF